MTHEELLAKIDDLHNASSDIGAPADKTYRGMLKFQQALRAVVELHKPGFAGDLEEYSCQECSDFEDSNYRIYPCDTIRAIEKELK